MYNQAPNTLLDLELNMVSKYADDGDLWLLSLLSQRLCLDLVFRHPRTVEFEHLSIEKYLAYLGETSPDREILYVIYTVEPLLSHVIAEAMWSGSRIGSALSAMRERLFSGMVNKGTIGKFVMRLIMMLAKDACARDLKPAEDELRYLGSVSIATFFLKMFGPGFFGKGSGGAPDEIEKLLSGRTINFVRWLSRETIM